MFWISPVSKSSVSTVLTLRLLLTPWPVENSYEQLLINFTNEKLVSRFLAPRLKIS